MDVFARRQAMKEEWTKNAKQCQWIGDITMEEVSKHRTPKDCWVVLNGFVYDFTQYFYSHPGGSSHFTRQNADITGPFNQFHPRLDTQFIEKLKIGKLVSSKN